MAKRIFHIFHIFMDFLLKKIWLKSFVKFLQKYRKIFLSLLVVVLGILVFYLSTWDHNDFLFYKNKLLSLSETHRFLSYCLYSLICFIFAFLGLPGAVFLGAIGGFIFGFLQAFVLSLVSSMLGFFFTFFMLRFFLRDFFIRSLKKSKKAKKLNKIYSRLKQDEIFYLSMFRLFPVTPLAITNIVMALGEMKFKVFNLICFLTIVPYLTIYVSIGSKLSQLEGWDDLYDPGLLVSFSCLALLPLAVKYLYHYLKQMRKKRYKQMEDLNSEDFMLEQI